MNKSIACSLLLLASGASAQVLAAESNDDNFVKICVTAAKEDGISPNEADAYIADCVDSLRAENGAIIAAGSDDKVQN